jgi:Zn-dependent peptidase ImmA (M78 family)/transcriptional regulator with XRE-family HTH domain
MSRKSFEVGVEPEVLVWARESMGMDTAEVAGRFNLSENTIKRWESGHKKPTIVQVKKLAEIYKRPLAAFFLPEPPKEPPFPNDFRTLPEERRKPFSQKTRLAIRKARRLQSLAMELARMTESEIYTNIGRASLLDDPEIVANKTRVQIGIDVRTQFTWEKDSDAFGEWRKAIERLGVLVFQLPLPVEETRGFSLLEDTLPTIVLNKKDHIRARIFTLFHEYGHLLLNTSGICNWQNQNSSPETDESVEKFCNHFAGAFLVPRDALLKHELVEQGVNTSNWHDEYFGEISRDFKVSREVILRRMLTLRLVSWNFYRTKYNKWRKKVKEKQEPKYLISIGMNYKQYLKEGLISRFLVDIFRNNNLVLTEDAKIAQKDDKNWEIRDKSRKYLIKDNGIHLKVYKGKGGGRQSIPQKCIRENSIPFISLVLDSYRREKITYNDIADYLGIRAKHIPKVEHLIEVGV